MARTSSMNRDEGRKMVSESETKRKGGCEKSKSSQVGIFKLDGYWIMKMVSARWPWWNVCHSTKWRWKSIEKRNRAFENQCIDWLSRLETFAPVWDWDDWPFFRFVSPGSKIQNYVWGRSVGESWALIQKTIKRETAAFLAKGETITEEKKKEKKNKIDMTRAIRNGQEMQ